MINDKTYVYGNNTISSNLIYFYETNINLDKCNITTNNGIINKGSKKMITNSGIINIENNNKNIIKSTNYYKL